MFGSGDSVSPLTPRVNNSMASLWAFSARTANAGPKFLSNSLSIGSPNRSAIVNFSASGDFALCSNLEIRPVTYSAYLSAFTVPSLFAVKIFKVSPKSFAAASKPLFRKRPAPFLPNSPAPETAVSKVCLGCLIARARLLTPLGAAAIAFPDATAKFSIDRAGANNSALNRTKSFCGKKASAVPPATPNAVACPSTLVDFSSALRFALSLLAAANDFSKAPATVDPACKLPAFARCAIVALPLCSARFFNTCDLNKSTVCVPAVLAKAPVGPAALTTNPAVSAPSLMALSEGSI